MAKHTHHIALPTRCDNPGNRPTQRGWTSARPGLCATTVCAVKAHMPMSTSPVIDKPMTANDWTNRLPHPLRAPPQTIKPPKSKPKNKDTGENDDEREN